MKDSTVQLGVSIVLVALIIAAAIYAFWPVQKAHACGFFTDCESPAPKSNQQEQKALESNQERLINAVPIPQLQDSLERKNVAKRAELFNKPDKISYIYFVNYGKVMAFYTVKGKVTSLNSYMVPQERLVYGDGSPCRQSYYSSTNNCYTMSAPDIDGSYGQNADGIFFFTTEGAYVEWKGDYMMSDQPLKLTTQPELIREIQ